ncbi:MAG: peptide-methionine (S)-S-oxide reductase MsrA [Halolamina sp.]
MFMTRTATLGGGCFWCIEAAFKEVDGVESATSGYAGGHVDQPSYREVCSGTTGHAEVVQLEYDPEVVSYVDLLAVFFRIHDPTSANKQGPDVGSQYRPAIFYHDDDQRDRAEAFVDRLEAEGAYDDPIVTEVEPLEKFYVAEEKHQDYYEKNPNDRYCQFHAEPKIEKAREALAEGHTAD